MDFASEDRRRLAYIHATGVVPDCIPARAALYRYIITPRNGSRCKLQPAGVVAVGDERLTITVAILKRAGYRVAHKQTGRLGDGIVMHRGSELRCVHADGRVTLANIARGPASV